MTPYAFRLVLLVSCAHAMVHFYEFALPSVEQNIGGEFGVEKDTTGLMGTVWRVPFGAGALIAGWLADRFGSKRMLIIFLAGCLATCILTWLSRSLGMLFGVMFAMGCFASIYHPAGLAIISRETAGSARSSALGWHGIFGSLGIAAAPFVAGLMLNMGFAWRQYFLILAAPGALLAVALALLLKERPPVSGADAARPSPHEQDERFRIAPYVVLVTVGGIGGMIYASVMHFLTRYLEESGFSIGELRADQLAHYGATIVLICGAFGQGLAGYLARPGRLRPLLILVLLGNVPCLIWMSQAQGSMCLVAACVTVLVHLMNQPIYNSLVAEYVPHNRRSAGYGFSNMMCFGIGSVGPMLAGLMDSLRTAYLVLTGVALLGAALAGVLWVMTSRR